MSARTDTSWHPALLESLRQLPNIRQACQFVGITRAVLRQHREADPEFDAAVEVALQDGQDSIRWLIATKAIGTRLPDGTYKGGSERMMELLAKIHLPELRQRSTDITTGGRPLVPPRETIDIESLTPEQRRRLIAGEPVADVLASVRAVGLAATDDDEDDDEAAADA